MTAAADFYSNMAAAAAMQPINMLRREASDLLLLAFAGHESNFGTELVQIGGGPGRGPWQFGEPTTALVMANDATKTMARNVCARFDIAFDAQAIYGEFVGNLPLAYAFARLLLWADRNALPAVGNAEAAWAAYLRVWRPGKQNPQSWASIYATSLMLVRAAYAETPTA